MWISPLSFHADPMGADHTMPELELSIDETAIALFLPLLQKGVTVPARTGCTLRQLVCEQLGIAEDYLEQRIQTLFLDARPVDDVDSAIVHDGACLALSAAMPGLLGATMRKGGRYAAFRRAISAADDAVAAITTDGAITLKLFNMIAREVGEGLLARGVTVGGSDLKRTVLLQEIWQHIQTMRLDGRSAVPDEDFFRNLPEGPLRLTVTVVDAT